MSNRDIAKRYLEGSGRSKQPKLQDMYSQVVINEIAQIPADVVDNDTSTERATVKYYDAKPPNGKAGWRKARVSNKWIQEVLKNEIKHGESMSYMQQVLDHGKATGVFDDNFNINDKRVTELFEWFETSGVPRCVMGDTIKIIRGTGGDQLKHLFIRHLGSAKQFNFYTIFNQVLSKELSSLIKSSECSKDVSDGTVQFSEIQSLTRMRPAGEEGKTRGAAGPGEALLAFMFNGDKGEVGDLVLPIDGPEMDEQGFHVGSKLTVNNKLVELKLTTGRIGKDIRPAQVKALRAQFNKLGARSKEAEYYKSGDRAGELKPNTQPIAGTAKDLDRLQFPNYKPKEGENPFENMAEMLFYFSGIDGDYKEMMDKNDQQEWSKIDVNKWLEKNDIMASGAGGGSTYDKIIQLCGGIQIKNYMTKVASFDYIAVFKENGDMVGFDSKELARMSISNITNTLRKNGVHFGYRDDANGFHIAFDK